jgi:alpha-ketoglutarate-dependent 2,4-dichlorophenoxyacetate dioxygenase
MAMNFTPLHPLFAAEVSGIDLSALDDEPTLAAIRAGMDEYAVLVFRDQVLDDAGQLAFARRFDGELHTKTGISALAKSRLGEEALADISNVDGQGKLLGHDDRKRQYGLANRLWHTDASFQEPPGRYSMLSTRYLPQASPNTEYADMRAAYDALPLARQEPLENLTVHHSIAYSRQVLGFEFSEQEAEQLAGAVQPLIRVNPNTGRRGLYLAAHCSRIIDMPLPDGRLLLRDLIEHATQRQFVYSHAWRLGDFVIYDNRFTMHRALPFDDTRVRRELRRVTTLDIPQPTRDATARTQ